MAADLNAFFGDHLYRLELTEDQINEQDLAELKLSLQRVDDALAHPASFGVVRADPPPRRPFAGRRKSAPELTDVTIMPLLLEAKTLIQDRLDDQRPFSMPRVGIDSVVKGLGLAGVVAFGALFTAYHQFYAAVGIRPEDIGINYAYVLARSVGLALVLLAAAVYAGNGMFVVTVALARRRRKGRPELPPYRKTKLAFFSVLAAAVAFVVWYSGDRSAVTIGFATFLISACLAGIAIVSSKRYVSSRWETGSVAVCVLLGFAVGLAVYAHDLGKAVRDGSSVEPVSILGAPLLDVRARPVRVQWAGPAAQKPDTVFGDETEICAVDLGRSATTQFLVKLQALWTTGDGVSTSPPAGDGSGSADPDLYSSDLLQVPVAMVAVQEAEVGDCGDG